MSIFFAVLRFSIAVPAVFLLSACGGGGGGGGGSGAGNSTSPLSLSTSVLTFDAPNTTTTPPSQVVTATVTGVNSGVLYIKIVSSGPAVASISNVTITGQTTGQATVFPASANLLGPGSFSSTITVTACTTDPNCSSGQLIGTPQTINVTYTVRGVVTSVSRLDYVRGNTPITGDANRQFTITAFPNQNWNSVTSVPWLSALPASGDTGSVGTVTASLVQSALDKMSNGTYTGTVTLTLSSGTIVTIPTRLTIARTQVNQVAPYVAISSTSGEVIIRGENFNQATIQDVTFGGVSSTAFNIVSNTEIHATYPILPAGSYPVNLQNNLAVHWSFENLVVITPKSYTASTVQYPRAPLQTLALEYDAEREAILVAASYYDGINFNTASRMGNQILRYQFTNGVLSGITIKDIPLLQDITLSTNGRQLIAITDDAVIHLDPVALTEIHRSTSSLYSGYYLKDIIATNDGNVLITTGLSGSGGTPTYLYSQSQYQFQNNYQPCNYFASPGVSMDGSLAVLIQGGLSPIPPLCSYTSSNGLFTSLPIVANQTSCMNSAMGTCRPPSLNKSGDRIAVIDISYVVSIYDRNFILLGRLPGQYGAVTFSTDSTRVYGYASNGVLRTFDLTVNTVSGQFQEIGTGTTLTGSPGTGIWTYPGFPYQIVKLIASPDGRTLFLAGGNQVVIQPAP